MNLIDEYREKLKERMRLFDLSGGQILGLTAVIMDLNKEMAEEHYEAGNRIKIAVGVSHEVYWVENDGDDPLFCIAKMQAYTNLSDAMAKYEELKDDPGIWEVVVRAVIATKRRTSAFYSLAPRMDMDNLQSPVSQDKE